MTHSSIHHSLDIDIAKKYGVEEALLIHHFQHWIRKNAERGFNFYDERTWTYQTREDIASSLPYLNPNRVRRLTDRLVKLGVLRKGNFNKSPMDKTLWYAFENEENFAICQNCQSSGKSANRDGKSAKAIPDTKTSYSKPSEEPSIKVSKNSEEVAKAPKSAKASGDKVFSDEIKDLGKTCLEEMKRINPSYKVTASQAQKWMASLDLMLRVDGRTAEQLMAVFRWALDDPFWRDKMFKPDPIKYLRKMFDQFTVRMSSAVDQEKQEIAKNNCKINRSLFFKWKAEYPDVLADCYVKNDWVVNKVTGKDVRLDLDPERFAELLEHVGGGSR